MSTGLTRVAGGLLIPESEASVPTEDGVGLRSKAGQLQTAVKGGAWVALGGGSSDTWFQQTTDLLRVIAPAATRYEYIKAGQQPNAAATVAPLSIDPAAEGGAMGVASDTLYSKFSSSVWQTPRTSPIAVAFRCKFPAISAPNVSLVGAATTGSVGILTFGWNQPSSASKWIMLVSGGATQISTLDFDTNWHTICLGVNLSTPLITALVDGVTAATSAATATLTNSACHPASFSSNALAPGVLISRIAYGYIDPT